MATIKKSIRTTQALQVIKHSTGGMTVSQACREVGIARSSFYYFIVHNPDAIASFQELERTASLRELALILANKIHIVELFMQDALADTTKPRDRLAIMKYMNERMDELVEKLQLYSRPDYGDLRNMLTGPKLVEETSRFSAFSPTIPSNTTSGSNNDSIIV
jgi:ACT domain-containing protein